MTDKATMPETLYATPRGSGTCSGVYVDMPMGDEDRGEHKYINADKHDSLAAVAGKMAEVLEAIERSNLQIPIDTQATQAYAFEVDAFKLLSASALTAYNALMKGR